MPSQGKAQLACKPCRSLKVRCLPSQEGDVCQKCVRSGAECIFEEQKPRRKRDKPDSRARVAALERKLEEVIAQISQSNKDEPSGGNDGVDNIGFKASNEAGQRGRTGRAPWKRTSRTAEGGTDLPTPESQTRDGYTSQASHTPGGVEAYPYPATSVFNPYPSDGAKPELLVSRGLLSIENIERYLGVFREMCDYFPYVVIPLGATAYSLLEERPLLLHAILAVSTCSDVHLQKVLERSFKEIMLSRLMLEAEKSIDLLQSILICMAWGHFFHIPKRDQSYQLLQMAIALCVDLGLNLMPSVAIQKIGLHLEHFQPSGIVEGDEFWCREARRAFLGCYHVSTMNNWIWAKPNTLAYSGYILQCAKSISNDPEYVTDQLVLPLIQLQVIGDEYHDVLRIGKDNGSSESHLNRLGTHSRSFHKQIQDLHDSLTPTAAASPAVQLAIHFASVHAHEQDLLSPWALMKRLPPTGPSLKPTPNPINCPSRMDLLLTCLQSATSFIDLFLTLPLSTYPHLSTTPWSSLIYSLVIIYRLSIGTPRIPLWDVHLARDTVRLERYFETLCERIQQVTGERLHAIADTNKRDLYSVMGLVMQNVRNTYERLRHLPQALSAVDGGEVHATNFPDEVVEGLSKSKQPQPRQGPIFDQELPKPGYQSRCPAMQFWSLPDGNGVGGTETMGDELFADMDLLNDDGFWNQTFAMEQARWDMDLGMNGI